MTPPGKDAMRSSAKPAKTSPPDLDEVGGTAVLNFINTLRADAGTPLETLHTDDDVLAWLKKAGMLRAGRSVSLPGGALLPSARRLRALALSAVEQKGAGKHFALSGLNDYLAQAASHLELTRTNGVVRVRREYGSGSAEQMLAALADAIAEFLATADFSLVHQCEGSGCVLWFLDRPNGRRRRFCSEETCGTRTRVAAHRARHAKLSAF